MIAMAASFALMNVTFVSAMALGSAANASVLQYTAPMWMYLASVWWLGEQAERSNFIALTIGLIGIGVIFFGGWQEGQLAIIGVALVSGMGYAGVMICLRVLRGHSASWLTVLNHLAGGFILLPFIVPISLLTLAQFAVLFVYGAVQMAVPYWLVTRGLRTVSPQEAGTITLLEPLLNPLWTYLIAAEKPPSFTLIGGAFILGALAWRYGLPQRKYS